MEFLLAHGADANASTRIDDCATPLEEAGILALTDIAEAMQKLTSQI